MPRRSKTRLMGDAITDTAILKYDGTGFEKKSANEAWLTFDVDQYPHLTSRALDLYNELAEQGAQRDQNQQLSTTNSDSPAWCVFEFPGFPGKSKIRSISITPGQKSLTMDFGAGEGNGGPSATAFQTFVIEVMGFRPIQEPDPRHCCTHWRKLGAIHAHYFRRNGLPITKGLMNTLIWHMGDTGVFDTTSYDAIVREIATLQKKIVTAKNIPASMQRDKKYVESAKKRVENFEKELKETKEQLEGHNVHDRRQRIMMQVNAFFDRRLVA